jgi:hypothetical protein
VFVVATAFTSLVMPCRLWDSLAFDSWSQSIAAGNDLWAGVDALKASRPLFYVPQSLLWRYLTEDEWIGRLLSATFAVVLVASVWQLARQLSSGRSSRDFLLPLAVGVLLSSSGLVERALEVGFEGTRIERTGCSTFRVVVTEVPDDHAVQEEFR